MLLMDNPKIHKEKQNFHLERTKNIYEDLRSAPIAPMVPLPDINDPFNLDSVGVKNTPLGRTIYKTSLVLRRFNRFYRSLDQNLSHYLKTVDLRGGILFAPVISATLALADDPDKTDPVQRAASLILAAYQLYNDLYSGALEPEESKGVRLNMCQYPNLFSTSLTVENHAGRIFKSTQRDYVTVLHRGQFFKLEVGDPSQLPPPDRLSSTLRALIDADAPAQPSPGILTCTPNLLQINYFSALQKQAENQQALEILKHSFMTFALDLDDQPATDAEALFLAHSRNCHNRWHHASVQLVIFGNGKACAIFNFNAYLDGNTMMRGAAEIQKRAARLTIPKPSQQSPAALLPFQQLSWHIPQNMLEQSHKAYRRIQDDQQATFELPGFGSTLFEKLGLPGVPFFVTALLWATWEISGEFPNIHQFLSMTKYRYMDLTSTNVTTDEMIHFLRKISRSNLHSDAAFALLQQAIQSQINRMRRARKTISIGYLMLLFSATLPRWHKLYNILIHFLTLAALKITGQFKDNRRHISVSHPYIYKEVPLVGRPGVRLPYVKYYALHYQIWPDRTVVTIMPGMKWRVPNREFIERIREKLTALKEIAEGKG